ncbi:hypothetical protein BD560DRAFT_303146, partial [Blakeslea trispora]
LQQYIFSLKQSPDLATLKRKLLKQQEASSSEWVRQTLLEFIHLFECKYLPFTDQIESDLLRRV